MYRDIARRKSIRWLARALLIPGLVRHPASEFLLTARSDAHYSRRLDQLQLSAPARHLSQE